MLLLWLFGGKGLPATPAPQLGLWPESRGLLGEHLLQGRLLKSRFLGTSCSNPAQAEEVRWGAALTPFRRFARVEILSLAN